jgi:hypothetical protein
MEIPHFQNRCVYPPQFQYKISRLITVVGRRKFLQLSIPIMKPSTLVSYGWVSGATLKLGIALLHFARWSRVALARAWVAVTSTSM